MVVIQAFRLSDKAKPGEILISSRVHAAIEDAFDAESIGEIELKGFHQPVPAFAVNAAKGAPA
jgi:class 3 adenylate cyclase